MRLLDKQYLTLCAEFTRNRHIGRFDYDLFFVNDIGPAERLAADVEARPMPRSRAALPYEMNDPHQFDRLLAMRG
jgi:hypothetical protein